MKCFFKVSRCPAFQYDSFASPISPSCCLYIYGYPYQVMICTRGTATGIGAVAQLGYLRVGIEVGRKPAVLDFPVPTNGEFY